MVKFRFLVLIFLFTPMTSCGVKGPPLPPIPDAPELSESPIPQASPTPASSPIGVKK